MRILFLSSMCLFRESRFGGAKRLYYYARELQRHADLHLMVLDGCREIGDVAFAPPEFPHHLYVRAHFEKSLRRTLGVPIDFTPDVRRQEPAIQAFLGGQQFDAIFVAYALALSFLGRGLEDAARRVVYLEDDLMLESYRVRATHGANLLRRALDMHGYGRMRSYYRERLARVATLVTISAEEQGSARALFPQLPSVVLPYGIPEEEYPLLPPPSDLATLGFIGNYAHEPNRDALSWLLGEVFPAIRRGVPGARLVVAGKGIPPHAIERHRSDPALCFLEDVSQLESFYREVGVFINPVRTGRGVRTKLIEAAAYGRPILSTPLGAEGLGALGITLADTPATMLEGFRSLLEPDRWQRAVETGRRAVEARFTLSAVGRELLGILSRPA